MPLKKVHFIPLPSLGTSRAEIEWYDKDGVHLLSKGMELFSVDVEAGIRAVFSDVKVQSKVRTSTDGFQKAGKKEKRRINEDRKASENQTHHKQTVHPPGRNFQEDKRVNWKDDRFENSDYKRATPKGWKDMNRETDHQPHERNDHRFRNSDQYDGYQERKKTIQQDGYYKGKKNSYQQDGYFSDGWQDWDGKKYFKNPRPKQNNVRQDDSRHFSGGNVQFGQQGFRGQDDRTEYRDNRTEYKDNRDDYMPHADRDYLHRFVQNDKRY